MLRTVLYDIDGVKWIPSGLFKLTVEVDEDVPSDSLYAELADPGCGEIARISLYSGGIEVFRGTIDDETRLYDKSGSVLKLSARGPAAHLLDNEAEPCDYSHPSSSLMAERYAEPFGVKLKEEDETVYFGRQDVLKGSSCYSALKRFCAACYSGLPRISSTGELSLKGIKRDGSVRFGSKSGEVRFTRLEERRSRCKEISEVLVKTSPGGGYDIRIANKSALARGIRRRRYLNAALTESPMKCAEAMIENGSKKAYTIRLRCPGCLLGNEGKNAVVCDNAVSERSGLYISSLRYRLSAKGEFTDVILTRRESRCG